MRVSLFVSGFVLFLFAAWMPTAAGAAISCTDPSADPDQRISSCNEMLEHANAKPRDRFTAALISKLYLHRAGAYADKGLFDTAIREYDRIIALDPNDARAYNHRGLAYFRSNQFDRAMLDYEKAIALRPDYAIAYFNRASVHNKQGAHDRAIGDYEKAIELDRRFSLAIASLAWVLATTSHDDLRDGTRALRLARQAVETYHRPQYFEALAAALAETGQFDEAVRQQIRAIERHRELDTKADFSALQARLDLYSDGKPYRQN